MFGLKTNDSEQKTVIFILLKKPSVKSAFLCQISITGAHVWPQNNCPANRRLCCFIYNLFIIETLPSKVYFCQISITGAHVWPQNMAKHGHRTEDCAFWRRRGRRDLRPAVVPLDDRYASVPPTSVLVCLPFKPL